MNLPQCISTFSYWWTFGFSPRFSKLTKNIAIDILLMSASLGTRGRVSLGYKFEGGIARFIRYAHFNISSSCQIMFQIAIALSCCSLWGFFVCLFVIEIYFTCHKTYPFEVYNSIVFSIFAELYNCYPNRILDSCNSVFIYKYT